MLEVAVFAVAVESEEWFRMMDLGGYNMVVDLVVGLALEKFAASSCRSFVVD